MWKDYSVSFIRKNRASSISVMLAAFISALFLSLLCSLFFNFWNYEIERIALEEGDWQGRITGEISKDAVLQIENFANVDRAVINKELSEDPILVADVYFQNKRAIYRDMPLIAEKLGLEDSAVAYHETLLAEYLIHDPQDASPPLLLTFYLTVLLMVSVSLILIIHNSFAVSMDARVHQFGIFSSVGATPGQIRVCLLQEAAVLCILPILAGCLIGMALSFGIIQAVNLLASETAGRHEAVFQYHPLVFLVTILASFLTVFISAWLPAKKLSKLTPLQAIRNTGELQLKKKRQSRILAALFGIEGELAGNALRARRKALRTSTLSLTLSFLGFTIMLCFFTLSGISTNHTYFERYQDVWDVMVTVKDTGIEDLEKVEAIRNLQGVRSCVAYQKADAVCAVPKTGISREVTELGGLETVAGTAVSAVEDTYFVQAPLVILDDRSFEEYCGQLGVTPDTTGSIVLNRIWDSIHSNFRYKEFVPFIKEGQSTVNLKSTAQAGNTIESIAEGIAEGAAKYAVKSAAGNMKENVIESQAVNTAENMLENMVEIPVTAYTQQTPALREEYEDYALVQFIPLTLWRMISGQCENSQEDTGRNMGEDTYIRILAKERMTFTELDRLETDILSTIGGDYTVESENRLQERADNDNMIEGYMIVIGAFCALLAIIGIANVFSNTLGFLRQRKREFAAYMSVGMTPEGMRKLFFVEALVIAGRPILLTLPLTVLFVSFMITASYLDPVEFLVKAPLIPILAFVFAIFGFVGLAYYIGGKRMLGCNLADALRNDNM